MTAFYQLFEDGGWVLPPLLLCVAMLWWLLGVRLIDVWIPKASPQEVIKEPSKFYALGQFAKKAQIFHHDAMRMNAEFTRLQFKLDGHRSLIKTLTAIAPLLGLLGTVTGMMETFRGLGDSALFSQTGGVAGGIAQALLTTQVGLIIAAPAIIIGKYIDRLSASTWKRSHDILKWVKQCDG